MNQFQKIEAATLQGSPWLANILRPGEPVAAIEAFVYNADLLAVASPGSAMASIQIQADSDFAITHMTGSAIFPDGTIFYPNSAFTGVAATVQITDESTHKTFFANPTLFQMALGSAALPFWLPVPKVLARQTALTIAIANFSVAGTLDFHVNFHGARIYYGAPGSRS